MFTIPCPIWKILTLTSLRKKGFPPDVCRGIDDKVEFRVNGEKVDFAMKLGEGGEAFFVFQTEGDIPEDMQTSPIVSPVQSPVLRDVLTSVKFREVSC